MGIRSHVKYAPVEGQRRKSDQGGVDNPQQLSGIEDFEYLRNVCEIDAFYVLPEALMNKYDGHSA